MNDYDLKVKVSLEELRNTLHFIGDKVEPAYQREVKAVIKEYLEEAMNYNKGD